MSIFNAITNPFKIKEAARIHIDDADRGDKFCNQFLNLWGRNPSPGPKVLLCVGTDRSTGDCLGPLIGTKMEESGQDFFHVYGTLDYPVHASNLEEKIALIQANHKNPFIIAVDACLGRLETVGYINLGLGALKPGAGVNKKLPSVGDMYITGIVNVGGFMEYFVLQNTRLNMVMNMANLIAGGLLKAGQTLKEP